MSISNIIDSWSNQASLYAPAYSPSQPHDPDNCDVSTAVFVLEPVSHSEQLDFLRSSATRDEGNQALADKQKECQIVKIESIRLFIKSLTAFSFSASTGFLSSFFLTHDFHPSIPEVLILFSAASAMATARGSGLSGVRTLQTSFRAYGEYGRCMQELREIKDVVAENNRYNPSSDDGAVIDVEPERPVIPVDRWLPARFASDVVELKTALADTTQASLLNPTLPILGHPDFDNQVAKMRNGVTVYSDPHAEIDWTLVGKMVGGTALAGLAVGGAIAIATGSGSVLLISILGLSSTSS